MKKLALAIILMISTSLATAASLTLLSGAAAPVTGNTFTVPSVSPNRTHTAALNGASAVSAAVTVQGSDDGLHWVDLVTITLPQSGTTCDGGNKCDGAANSASWPFERCNLTAISGVGATVDCKAGY